MFFKKSKGILGLDIGTSGVKMVELEESKGSYYLKSFGNSLLPKETIVNGVLKNSSALVTAITNHDIRNSVPFFGRIPLLEFFFKGTSKTRQKTEMIIFITPTIVTIPKKSPTMVVSPIS